MYLLNSARFSLESQPLTDEDLLTVLTSRGGPTVEPGDRRLLEELQSIDPSYDPELRLPPRTVNALREILGESDSYYGWVIRHKELADRFAVDVGRAMVLSGLEFRLFDRIAANLTRMAFQKFSIGVIFEIDVAGKPIQLEELGNRIGLDGTALPFGAEGIPPLRISYADGRGSVQLELKMDPAGNRLRWYPRGLSRRRKRHLELVEELNSALEDFGDRVQWMECYRSAKPRPVLDSETRRAVVESIFHICADLNDPLALRSGIYFGDDSLTLKDGKSKLVFERCLDCEHPVSVSIHYAEGASDRFRGSCEGDAESADRILQRAHANSGCEGLLATSSTPGVSFSVIG